MDAEFRGIFEMSCEKGFRAIIDEAEFQMDEDEFTAWVEKLSAIKAIMDEAEWHSENMAEALDEHDGFHNKAFWIFLERPKYWPAASAFCRADAISSSQWNESRTTDHPPARADEASIRDHEPLFLTQLTQQSVNMATPYPYVMRF